ncbi:hypothetical protein BaRGS_00007686 [Batillaria attramentaria]|uniref:Uncharacterized protein n=1 Tax=Batillaria attramentaria TaxID=370345 RepID=A0ABD0LPN3_9CAEN
MAETETDMAQPHISGAEPATKPKMTRNRRPRLSEFERKRRQKERWMKHRVAEIRIGLNNTDRWARIREEYQLKDNPSVAAFLLDQ